MLTKSEVKEMRSACDEFYRELTEHIIECVDNAEGKRLELPRHAFLMDTTFESYLYATAIYSEEEVYFVETEVEHHYSNGIDQVDEPIELGFLNLIQLLSIAESLAEI